MNNTRTMRQVIWITGGAIALFFAVRLLPTGTNLEHADFRTDTGALEMCDPANPQFLPVAAVKSPVSVELKTDDETLIAGEVVRVRLVMKTAGGKIIGDKDLIRSHAEKLHLLIVDPLLEDYQHVHPVFENKDGAWTFSFTPKYGGVYRIFCDFVPAATSRGLYASGDLDVGGARNVSSQIGMRAAPDNGERFKLSGDVTAGKQATLMLSALGDVALEKIMDAYAHVVMFDLERGGFAHLHPMEIERTELPLAFKVTVPRAGSYIVWAQMRVGGEDVYTRFKLDVRE